MARQKVRLADNIARVIFVETDATIGATLGTNLFLPNGDVATPATLAAWLGGTALPQATQQSHQLLTGLTAGNDHPQYLLRATLTTDGDLLTRNSGSVTRLPIGLEGEVLTVVGGLAEWAEAQGIPFTEGLEPPPYPEVPSFWWDTYYEALYIYTSLGWYDVSTGTAGAPGEPGAAGSAYDPSTTFVAEDDFMLYPSNSAPNPWFRATSGSGAGISADNFGEAGHPGVLGLETGTTSAGFGGVIYGSRTSSARWSALKLGGGAIQFDALVKFPDVPTGLESYEITIGLGDSIDVPFSPVNEGVYFHTNPTSGEWLYCTRSNSSTVTEEADGSLTIAEDEWIRLTIKINAAGTEAEFYINNVLKHTATATFPTSALTMFATLYKTAGTTERFMYLDYMGVRQTFTTARW